MMKKLAVILTVVGCGLLAPLSLAATSEVKWTNPDDYRDVYAGEGNRAKFKAKVFADFEKHFAFLASKLPEGQTLLIDVSDVDLAGDVHLGSTRRIRVVKELFFPRLEFSYQLLDSNKNILKSGNVNLKDMNFMMGSSLRYSNDLIGYEKRMLDDWFSNTFLK